MAAGPYDAAQRLPAFPHPWGHYICATYWGTGYCANVAVTNTSTVKAVAWTVKLPVEGPPSSMWNGKYTLADGVMTLSGPDWNPDLAPDATNADPGFCASR